jgi:hypothetical protein
VLSLTATSTDPSAYINGWTISYGDGTTHSLTGDSVADLYTYDTTSSPSYTISAVVNDFESDGDYTASASFAVEVDPATATLSVSPDSSPAAGQPFVAYENLDDFGVHTLSSYSISWGDGNTDSDSTLPHTFTNSYSDAFTHTYATLGSYDVSVTSVTEDGTLNAGSAITVGPLFYVSDNGNGFTVGDQYDLTPTFSDPDSTLTGYTVSWGDGSSNTTYGPSVTDFSHVYSSDNGGAFAPIITASTSDASSYTTTAEADVAPPTLSVSAPSDATQGISYVINADVTSGQTAGSTYAFEIDWGDGSDPQDISSTPGAFSYAYSEPGTYDISVMVDGDGGGDFAEATVNVAVATPAVSISDSDATITAGVATSFTDSYSNPGDALDNLTVDWGDGNTDAYYLDPTSADHVYKHPGTYNVTDTFTTDHDTYTATATAEVVDAGSLTIGDDDSVNVGDTYTLGSSFSDPNGDLPTNYQVYWGDGRSNGYGLDPDHHGVFDHAYTATSGASADLVTVIATSADGTYTATQSDGVTVGDAPVAIAVQYGPQASVGEDFPLRIYPEDSSSVIASYTVDWGDGNSDTSSDTQFDHTYEVTTTGTYNNVSVTAYDNNGTSVAFAGGDAGVIDAGSGQVSVSAPGSVNEGDDFTISGSFTGPPDPTFEIWWGDYNTNLTGTTAGNQFTSDHAYSQPGTYTATVWANYSEDSSSRYAFTETEIDVEAVTPTLTVLGDTTATVTGDTYSLAATYTDPLGDHGFQNWSVSWGDGSSDYYDSEDSDPVFTHVYTTASTSGQEYTPEVSVEPENYSGSITASTNVMVAQPLMQVIQDDGTPMDRDAQHTTGAFISDDPGDQDTSLTTADPELVEVSLTALPDEVGGTYVLSVPDGFVAWGDPLKDDQLPNGQTFDATSPHSFWLQATAVSSQMGTDKVAVGWRGGILGALFVAVADAAAVTGVTPKGPKNVPAYGHYTYSVAGAVPAFNPRSDPWSVTGGSSYLENPNGTALVAAWDNPLNGAGSGWNGKIAFNYGKYHGVLDQINVVSIVVTTPTNAFANGIPADAGTFTTNGGATKKVAAAAPGNYGFSWAANVALNGPGNSATKITVGFVQNITQFQNNGDGYTARGQNSNFTTSSNLDFTADPNHVLLDQRSDQTGRYGNVWYSTFNGAYQRKAYNSVFKPTTVQNGSASTTLNQDDTPFDGPPEFPQNKYQLVHMSLDFEFSVYVVAQTQDAPDTYVEQSSIQWSFNGSGTTNPQSPDTQYAWTKDNIAKVTPATAWGAQITSGASPKTTGPNFNTLQPKEWR